ncbi:MAG: FAD-dependent oxidoreductase [Betaproteobacteria bacterium]|nr:FAD-dependent oxidoreductase [Betaproteobacteria bacterium]
MAPPLFDALIIGAGAAGLAAGAELARAGRSVLVLEARDRIGGRCWSLHEPGLPVPIELGAEFIHGRPAAMFSLLEKTGVAAVDAPFVRWTVQRGKLQPRGDDLFAEVRRALRQQGAALKKQDVSFETFLAHGPHGLSEKAQAFARMRAQGFEAADPARASARAIAEDWGGEAAADAGHFRPAGGYGALLASLAGELGGNGVELRLRTVVHTVRWKRGSVAVEGTALGKPFRATARRAIITLPLGVLQLARDAPGAVCFTPALKAKQQALEGLASGAVIKVALRFRAAFWEELDEARYRDASFFHSPEAAFPTFWTALPVRAPLLIAWAGGPKATRLSGAGTRDIIRQAVTSLKSVFGKQADIEARLEAAYVHDWQRDPFARGAYSYVTVGGAAARKALAAPLRDTLFFAGEATDDEGEAGTVAGALQSGTRAARQLINAQRNGGEIGS